MDKPKTCSEALAEFIQILNEYGDPMLGLQPGDLMMPQRRPDPPAMYVTRRGNVVTDDGRRIWHTWGLASIRDRKVMAEAFIAAAGRAPVLRVPATKSC